MLNIPLEDWRLVTDSVMGGVSQGRLQRIQRDGRECLRLSGEVSTRNNGGFIQIARDLDSNRLGPLQGYRGVRLTVAGNGETYNVHLRTSGLWFPWQAYRATFPTQDNWSTVEIPFEQFQGYKTSRELDVERLKRIGIVAIGREFDADICIAEVGLY